MGYMTENNVFAGFKSFLMGCKSISYIERSLFFHGHANAYVELPIKLCHKFSFSFNILFKSNTGTKQSFFSDELGDLTELFLTILSILRFDGPKGSINTDRKFCPTTVLDKKRTTYFDFIQTLPKTSVLKLYLLESLNSQLLAS